MPVRPQRGRGGRIERHQPGCRPPAGFARRADRDRQPLAGANRGGGRCPARRWSRRDPSCRRRTRGNRHAGDHDRDRRRQGTDRHRCIGCCGQLLRAGGHERDWGSQYDLMFSLRLERAECEFLSGNFEKAEQLIVELLQRAAAKVDQAAVYHLKVQFHVMKSENQQAVATALTCLRLFGIDIPAHPTLEQVQAEYETVWQTLGGRPIESLNNLPRMTDPEVQAAMQVFSVLTPAAYFTDFRLYCLEVCRMVKISMRYGTSGPSAQAYVFWAAFLGPVFHRYRDAYRFAK